MTQQSSSLASRLGFSAADLLPFPDEARWLTVGRERTTYTVSKRLFDAMEAYANEQGITRSAVFRDLRNEVNKVEPVTLENTNGQ